jgi:hypothetical protein
VGGDKRRGGKGGKEGRSKEEDGWVAYLLMHKIDYIFPLLIDFW